MAVPELGSFMCFYIVLHIEVQSRNLKKGRKKKMLWRRIKCIFPQRENKHKKMKISKRKAYTIWKRENTNIPGGKQRDCVSSVAQIVNGGRGYHQTKQTLYF